VLDVSINQTLSAQKANVLAARAVLKRQRKRTSAVRRSERRNITPVVGPASATGESISLGAFRGTGDVQTRRMDGTG
jgi:hypothetical protein